MMTEIQIEEELDRMYNTVQSESGIRQAVTQARIELLEYEKSGESGVSLEDFKLSMKNTVIQAKAQKLRKHGEAPENCF